MEPKLDPVEYCKLLSSTIRTAYNAIGRVSCQILQKNVVFNAKGFHLPLAVAVVRNATAIDEEREVIISKKRKKGAKRVKAKQYALVATVGRNNPVRVRVIVMEVENSQNPIFWSIMRD
ncbi:MAG: hypothetical protein WCW03_02550 [Candidatus Paceibacterota bacterium]|jgi:hypothetical protein